MPNIYVGTSGWNYLDWKERFYPKGLSQARWLDHYTKFFNTVELNVTFYRLVKKEVFQGWYRQTPRKFSFVVKGSRYITHIKRLKDCRQPLNLFISNARGLKDKLVAVLWQLPPGFKKDLKRLEAFLRLAKKSGLPQVFEFRHPSWFDREVYALLEKYNSALCIAHSSRYPCVKRITASFTYLRFHGGRVLYGGNYSDRELRQWAGLAKKIKVKDIFAFFNNDAGGFAVKNAIRFKKLLS